MKHEAVSTVCGCFQDLRGLSKSPVGLSEEPRVKTGPSRQDSSGNLCENVFGVFPDPAQAAPVEKIASRQPITG